MSSNGHPEYEVGYLPVAKQQVQDLGATAAAQGKKKALAAALNSVLEKLRKEPSTWGDPAYNLKNPADVCIMGFLSRC
jgi:hypothetical protein